MTLLRECVVLDERTYARIYRELNSVDDVPRLSHSHNFSRSLLETILRQKISRGTRKRCYKLWAKRKKLLRAWLAGESFISIALKNVFSPVMTAFIVLRAAGWPRKKVAAALRSPSKVESKRIARELKEAAARDLVYSPSAAAEQMRHGKEVEEKVARWLASLGAAFLREREQNGRKTPDFLLKRPLKLRAYDQQIHWIECKASFGDLEETRRDARKQLEAYRRVFGPGMVVYWHGYVRNHARVLGVVFESQRALRGRWR